jgi:hypothetical protein
MGSVRLLVVIIGPAAFRKSYLARIALSNKRVFLRPSINSGSGEIMAHLSGKGFHSFAWIFSDFSGDFNLRPSEVFRSHGLAARCGLSNCQAG